MSNRWFVGVAAIVPVVVWSCVAVEPPSDEVGAAQAALTRANHPPGGLAAAQVPQFVAVTFDDNFSAEGMTWATTFLAPLHNPAGTGSAGTFDGTPVRTSFFHNSLYLGGATQTAWQVAVADGHETGDHTVNHPFGLNYDAATWGPEVSNCRSALASGLGISQASVRGFRTPYLGYNDALFDVLAQSPAFAYDTSIESCWADGETGGTCAWPYTLEAGSADAAAVVAKFGAGQARPVGAHAGLWELPVTTLIVPPDAVAAQYGFPAGLRQRLASALAGKSAPSFYDASTGKLAGLDITMIVDGGMTKAEALATLKYTLDLHLAGNRAPFVFVAHTHVYASGYGAAANVPSTADRRAIVEGFIGYALSKPAVRMRPLADVMGWMKAPVALGGVSTCTPSCGGRVCGDDGCGGSCGTCGAGQACTASGTCQSTCAPSCSGRVCGDDGCGGSCGTCGASQTCTASGTCQSSGTGSCGGAPDWSAGTSYAAGDVVAATCTTSTVGTTCYGKVGTRFTWTCANAGWCPLLRPGSDQGGWWSAWTSLATCN